MKSTNIILLFLMIFLSSCEQNKESISTEVEKLVGALRTDDDKMRFLEKIFEEDQKVRDSKEDAELVLKYGRDSKQSIDYTKRQWQQDEDNLLKIEYYIEKYGYPNKSKLGEYAALAPWIVIHHSMHYEVRIRNFQTLFKAYLNENIDDNALAMYLGRSYRMKFNKDFYIESPFKAEDELNGLIKALDLEEEQLSVLSEL